MEREMTQECGRVQQLWGEESCGRVLDEVEMGFVDRHLGACERCATEAAAVSAMDLSRMALSPFKRNDIDRRRWIDQTIDRAGRLSIMEEPAPAGHWRMAVPIAASVVFSAVGLWLLLGMDTSATGDPVEKSLAPMPVQMAPVPLQTGGRVLLMAGEGQGWKNAILAGDEIRAQDGQLAVDMGTGIRLLFAGGSRARVERLDTVGIVVALESGRMLASVDPNRQGPPFSVVTGFGDVHVKGTVFSIDVDPAARMGKVSVYRGSVRLGAHGQDVKDDGPVVSVGQAVLLGDGTNQEIDEDTAVWARSSVRMLDLLGGSEDATVLVRSLPHGATVVMDDVVLGTTPVWANVRHGHRTVELSMEERSPVTELLELGKGTQVMRVFELKDLEPAGTTSTQALPQRDTNKSGEARKTASQMLTEAQSLRKDRRWKDASAAYERLITAYPTSTEGKASLISLGNIQMDHLGAPGAALQSFDRYLSNSAGGTLTQEAAYSRCRALGALRRIDAERRALSQFLVDYPTAIQRQMVQDRLAELEK